MLKQQLPVKALLKLFKLRIWVRVHVYGRGFHSACKGSLAAMSQHVQSRGPAGEASASVIVPEKNPQKNHNMIRHHNSVLLFRERQPKLAKCRYVWYKTPLTGLVLAVFFSFVFLATLKQARVKYVWMHFQSNSLETGKKKFLPPKSSLCVVDTLPGCLLSFVWMVSLSSKNKKK